MSLGLSPIGNDAPFVDANGDPLSGGKLYVYLAGSATPATTYQDAGGTTPNANPIVLNSNGYPASGGSVVEIWLTDGASYLFELKTSADVLVWTRDDIEVINDTSVTNDQWVTGPTPTYISATSFSLVGDQTTTFHVGRRLQTTNTGGTVYSTILTSAFTSLTTITVLNDSGTLDAGLSAVSYGLLSDTNHAVPSFQAKGDILTQSAAGTIARLAVGANGTIPMARSANSVGLAYVAALNMAIYGLTYANNGSDATNDLDIAAGGAMDATGAYWMTLSAITKKSDAAWSVGTDAGALDTGAVGNSDYYIWLISRSDTGVVDVLFSLSSTAPTMPAQYDFKRLIGWFKRVGGTIVPFTTYEANGGGIELLWNSPTLDVNLANTLTTARRTDAVKVPLNFSVLAHLNVVITDASSASVNWIYCPDQADLAPSSTVAPLANMIADAAAARSASLLIRTSATGTVAARSSLATVDLYAVSTMGFTWARRN